eukprot:CAMPEP_0175381128 /NCGR_PEP_ID=MMETSP0095-20121207/26666_1 /TAXON_ID=311494 /ORGANISM="Alexandrium monilatum, Strain CCMP3105" /LENGTH=655 /DNA_ID=CAMNT_0016679503 /DNA_START=63 /DNA_END=2027 /DNA_ORIENTATION=+
MGRLQDDYEHIRCLGHGSYGIVDLWRQRRFNCDLVVAKRITLDGLTSEQEAAARRESKILRSLKHPHVVKFLSSWVDRQESELVILQEYLSGGDLSKAIKAAREGHHHFEEERVLRWFAQLWHALQYCHSHWNLMHNIFMSSDHESAHLGDFGVSKLLASGTGLTESYVGTHLYMAPEVLQKRAYGLKSDVWGLGTIFYEICTLVRPFDTAQGTAISTLEAIISSDGPRPFPSDARYPCAFEVLCASMLGKDPGSRPAMGQLLREHRVFRAAVIQLELRIGWEDSLIPECEPPGMEYVCEPDRGTGAPGREAESEEAPSPVALTPALSRRSSGDLNDPLSCLDLSVASLEVKDLFGGSAASTSTTTTPPKQPSVRDEKHSKAPLQCAVDPQLLPEPAIDWAELLEQLSLNEPGCKEEDLDIGPVAEWKGEQRLTARPGGAPAGSPCGAEDGDAPAPLTASRRVDSCCVFDKKKCNPASRPPSTLGRRRVVAEVPVWSPSPDFELGGSGALAPAASQRSLSRAGRTPAAPAARGAPLTPQPLLGRASSVPSVSSRVPAAPVGEPPRLFGDTGAFSTPPPAVSPTPSRSVFSRSPLQASKAMLARRSQALPTRAGSPLTQAIGVAGRVRSDSAARRGPRPKTGDAAATPRRPGTGLI